MEADQMTYVLDGGLERTRRRRYIENIGRQHLQDAYNGQYVCKEIHPRLWHVENLSRRFKIFRDIILNLDLRLPKDIYHLQRILMPNELGPLENVVFSYAGDFRVQATDLQVQRWTGTIRKYELFPNFAQTELGHGSHVRGIETTATYNRKSHKFLLNTSSITSLKWWSASVIGISKYFIVIANIVVDDKIIGIGHFVVPFYDDQGEPYPGVSHGDIGPSMGCNSMSLRYYRLCDVRVPADSLLGRKIKINDEGNIQSDNNVIIGSHTRGRCQLIHFAARDLADVTSACITYCESSNDHRSLLHDPLVGMILFPRLCEAYAFWITHQYIDDLQDNVVELALTGDNTRIKALHGITSGLKAYMTLVASRGMREMISNFCDPIITSDLMKIYTNIVSIVTADGDETVMMMQTARYMLGHVLYSNGRIDSLFDFVLDSTDDMDLKMPSISNDVWKGDMTDQDCIDSLNKLLTYLKGLHHTRAHRECERIKYILDQDPGLTRASTVHDKLHRHQVILYNMAQVTVETFIVRSFADKVVSLPKTTHKDVNTGHLFYFVCIMYSLDLLLKNKGHFMQLDIVTTRDIERLVDYMDSLLDVLKKHCLVLVDAFDFPFTRELRKRLKTDTKWQTSCVIPENDNDLHTAKL